MVRRIVESSGYKAIEAPTGVQGVKLFEQHRPDLVICDVIMPDMEGIETVRALRKLDATARIIAISGDHHPGIDVLGFMQKFGAAEALEKPFRREELLDAVARVIG
jgi:two-component system chemotaxis response regulator CheY